MGLNLDTPAQFIKGVGPQRAKMLEVAGIRTVEDLVKYQPFRYEDRTDFRRISELEAETESVIRGTIDGAENYSTPRKGMRILEMLLRDESGSVRVKFFNQPYLGRVLKRGTELILFGVPRMDTYSGGLTFANPEFEIWKNDSHLGIHTGRIVPVYRRIGKLTTRSLRQILFVVIEQLGGELEDPLPVDLRRSWKFPGLLEAYRALHFPVFPTSERHDDYLKALAAKNTPHQRRLIFEEFFSFHLGLSLVKRRRQRQPKIRPMEVNDRIRQAVKSILPFRLTEAQKRVTREIVKDLSGTRVMSRLLQGDVGSGKTIVAVQAMIVAIENGFQTALMAPTELLAEQHHQTILSYLNQTPYRVALLTGSTKASEKRDILARAEAGNIDLLVGTHSLIQKEVRFDRLGFVVIDEQHRFGVMQRAELMGKGTRPDTLVMTATPIPRSLAMTLYGDLEISVLDEIPPGRKKVTTIIRREQDREAIQEVLRKALNQGRQVYVVCPLVEESEKTDLRAATETALFLKKAFKENSVGLMHGRLKGEEKEAIMQQFRSRDIQMLVSTTVIEVGIDVPNASVMVIEHAERFGLSQLHQLRGRIGRGDAEGLCILMVENVKTREAYERLKILRQSSDGFKIAEKDLEIRGPGEFLGTRQAGMPQFRFGDIVRDRKLLELARQEVEKYLEKAGISQGNIGAESLKMLTEKWRNRFGLWQVG